MNRVKCQFVKNGIQCKAYPINDSEYCYAHTRHKQDYIRTYARDDKGVCGINTIGGEYVPLELYEPGEFFSVPKRIFDPDIARQIGVDGIAVFCCLCSHVKRFNDSGDRMPAKAFPKVQTIARECGCGVKKVRRAIKKLVDCNILYVLHRWKNEKDGRTTVDPEEIMRGKWESTSNLYYIVDQWEWHP